jgi:hypothetical protein
MNSFISLPLVIEYSYLRLTNNNYLQVVQREYSRSLYWNLSLRRDKRKFSKEPW